MSKGLLVGGLRHDGAGAAVLGGMIAQTAHIAVVHGIRRRKETDRLLGEVAFAMVNAAVKQHLEKRAQLRAGGEKARVARIAVHQRGRLVVDIATHHLSPELDIVLRGGDGLLIEALL